MRIAGELGARLPDVLVALHARHSAEAVRVARDDRLDDVPMCTGQPEGAVPVLARDPRIVMAYGRNRPRRHGRHRFATGERHRRRMLLDDSPEWILRELAQLLPLPVAVAAFDEIGFDRRRDAGQRERQRLQAAVQRGGDDGGEWETGEPLPHGLGLGEPHLVEVDGRATRE